MEAEENILNQYKNQKCLNDKEFSFILTTCCIKSKIQTISRNIIICKNFNEKIFSEKIFSELDNLLNPILKYKNVANILDEDINLSLLRFEIFEQFPLGDNEDKFEMIEEGLSFSMLILELERIAKEEEYGLDDQKLFFCVSKKNEWRNYIPIQDQTWLSLPEFLKIYSLSEIFQVKHSLKLEDELYFSEQEFIKNEIIRTTKKLDDLKERWNNLGIKKGVIK